MNAAIETPIQDVVIGLLSQAEPIKRKKAPTEIASDTVLLDIKIDSLELLDVVMNL